MQTTGPSTLATTQTITGTWADLGGEIDCRRSSNTTIFLNLDINDAANVRIRALAKHTKAGDDEYSFPIKVVSASDVKVEAEYVELNVDADQKLILNVETDGSIPYIQFQIMAGTAGTTGKMSAVYTKELGA